MERAALIRVLGKTLVVTDAAAATPNQQGLLPGQRSRKTPLAGKRRQREPQQCCSTTAPDLFEGRTCVERAPHGTSGHCTPRPGREQDSATLAKATSLSPRPRLGRLATASRFWPRFARRFPRWFPP
jgi:hypothetical protein